MVTRYIPLFSLCLLPLLICRSVCADSWVVNPAHSEVLFEVPFLKWSEVTGRFEKLSGFISFNQKTHNPEKLELKIEASSLDTGNDMRDGHLRGSDFFQTKVYPLITFHGAMISRLPDGNFEVKGQLTIRNRTRPHRLRFTLSQPIKDTWGFESRFAKFTTEVDRREFGFNWNKTLEGQEFLIGEIIKVRGSIQVQPEASTTPNSKHLIPDTAYIRNRERLLRGEIAEPMLPVSPLNNQDSLSPSTPLSSARVAGPEAPIVSPSPSSSPRPRPHPTALWWISFILLGMFGFFGVAIVGVSFKKLVSRTWPNQYEESGVLAALSDFLVIILVFVYSWAFWFVGWG